MQAGRQVAGSGTLQVLLRDLTVPAHCCWVLKARLSGAKLSPSCASNSWGVGERGGTKLHQSARHV